MQNTILRMVVLSSLLCVIPDMFVTCQLISTLTSERMNVNQFSSSTYSIAIVVYYLLSDGDTYPDICCFVQLIVFQNLYNCGGECKVSTNQKATKAHLWEIPQVEIYWNFRFKY